MTLAVLGRSLAISARPRASIERIRGESWAAPVAGGDDIAPDAPSASAARAKSSLKRRRRRILTLRRNPRKSRRPRRIADCATSAAGKPEAVAVDAHLTSKYCG